MCGQCGRRVPRTVATCRCGATLSALELTPRTGDAASSGSAHVVRSVLAAALGGAAVVFALVWVGRPEPNPQPVEPSVAAMPPATAGDPRTVTATSPAAVAPPQENVPSAPASPPAPSLPQVSAGQPASASLEEVVARALPAVVLVESAEGRGSAFFVAPDTLLTNVHVVGNSSSVTIKRLGGATATARVERRAPQFDLAVLKLTNADVNQAVIALASAATARPGQEVIAIGSALGTLQNTVTRGIVSGLRESGGATLVQTDAAVNPGNSGGPLLNRDGQAIGITTMGYAERQGLNFAVAADHARALVEGRPVPAAAPGLSRGAEVQGLSPAVPTVADRARTDGTRAYQDAMATAARHAQTIDDNWGRFKASCYGGTAPGGPSSFDREWFVLFEPQGLSGTVAPGCGAFFSDLRLNASTVRDAVLKAEEAARQAGVYPGVRREAKRVHRLDYPGWER